MSPHFNYLTSCMMVPPAGAPFAYDGMPTPFGTEAGVKIWCDGIAWVETNEHGGIKLSKERNSLIPKHQRMEGGWYEYCQDWVIPCAVFATELLALKDKEITKAVKEAKKWYDPEYAYNG